MPKTLYSEIIGTDTFKGLSAEDKKRVSNNYWDEHQQENPGDVDYANQRRQLGNDLIEIQQKKADAAPVARRQLDYNENQLLNATVHADLARSGAFKSNEEYAASLAASNLQLAEQRKRLDKTALLSDEQGGKTFDSAITALRNHALNEGVFAKGPVRSIGNVNLTGGAATALISSGQRGGYQEVQKRTADLFGLEPEELDDVVKHQMGLQDKPVSRDALGTIHIKPELLSKPVGDIEAAIKSSDLPESVKQAEIKGLSDRVTKFKADYINNVVRNHPQLTKTLEIDPTEDPQKNFDKLTTALNTSAVSQAATGAGSAFAGTVSNVEHILGLFEEKFRGGSVPYLEKRSRIIDSKSKEYESLNQISYDLNKEQTKLWNTNAGIFGQGIYSAAESMVLGAVAPEVAFTKLASLGKVGEVLAGGLKGAARVAPVAGYYGAQQGIQTYDQAIKAGKSEDEAQRLALRAGVIEGGTTMFFSALHLPGTENVLAPGARESFKESARQAYRSTLAAFGKGAALAVVGEQAEELTITALDQVLVQAAMNPNLTVADRDQALKDTFKATLIATALPSMIAGANESATAYKQNVEINKNQPISDLSTDDLEDLANDKTGKAAAQENISEEVLGSGNVTPPRPEDVAGLREELATLTAKRLPPGSPSFRERGRRVTMIEEQLSDYEAQKETPTEEIQVPVSEVPVGENAPTGGIPPESGTRTAAPAEAKAEAAVESAETLSPPTTAPEPTPPPTDEKESQGSESQAEKVLTEKATGEESPVAAGKPLKAIHYSREPLKLQKSKDIGSIKGRYEEESTFGEGFYAMEPQDEQMWTGMNRFSLGENRNEVTITPSNPLVVTPETGKTLDVDKALKDIEDGVYDAVVIRGFSEEVSSQIYDRVNELWEPKFPEGKTSGKFINPEEYEAALEQATEELTGISGKQYQKLFDAGMTQNQIFIPKDSAPDIVSTNENQKQKTSGTPPVESKPTDQGTTGKTEAGTPQRKGEGQEVISAPTKGKPTGTLPEGQPTSGDVGNPPSPVTVLDLVAGLMGVKNVAPQEEMLFDENGQRRLFQQSPQDKDQGNPAAKKFVASFKGSPPKNATRILLDYVGNQLLTSTSDLPKAIQRDIAEGNKLYERFTKVAKSGMAKVKVGRVNFNNFLSALWERKNKGKPVGWANQREPKYVRDNARTLAFEAAHALSKEGSGLDWYNYKIEAMFAELAKTYPELAEDGQERFLFSIILAVTSNGQDIVSNLADTIVNYNEMRGKDTLPEKITMSRTTRLAAAQRSINTINEMLKTRTWKELKKELLTKTTAGQIEKTYGKKVTGEVVDAPMLNAMLLGPKIGAYWANLNGNFDPITMDMWFVRTLNRVAGDLTTVDPGKLLNDLDKLENLDLPKEVQEDIKDYRKAVADAEDWVSIPADIREDLPALYNFTKDIFNKYVQGGFTDRNKLNVASKSFVEHLDGSNSAPDNSTHRKWMREVLGETRKILKRNGIEITNADLQAVLWFHEKDIYTKFGATSAKGQREDYETGVLPAMRLAQSRMSQTGNAIPSTTVKAETGDMFGGMEFAAKPAVKTDFQGRKLFQQSKEDAEYLAAVEAGDMETAQRMVDQAAQAAGYLLERSHGTRAKEFTVFKSWSHFGDAEQAAEFWGNPDDAANPARIIRLFLNIANPYRTSDEEANSWGQLLRKMVSEGLATNDQWRTIESKSKEAGEAATAQQGPGRAYADAYNATAQAAVIKILAQAGFDGIVYANDLEGSNALDSHIPFSPNQIKSADPVTRDAKGNIIPLSQRFNPESPSILYQQPQGPKGSFQLKGLSEAIIEFFKTADPSTAIHEFAHAVRGFFLDKDVPAENRYGITDEDIDTVTNWATDGTGNWDRKAEEKWARGIERFFWEGISTGVKAVDDVLAKLSKWMRDVYQSIKGSDIDIEISPEVRAVMEKLVKRGETLKAEGKAPTPVKIAVKTYTPPAPKKKQMVPSEVFSPKNAVTEAQLAKFGLADRTDPDTRVNDEVLQEALNVLREDDTAGATLITKLEESGRIATDTELAILMHEAIKAETNAVKLYNAVVKGDTESRTPYEMARIRYEQILRLLQNQGTKAARALAFRRILVNRRMDVVKLKEMIRTAKAYGSKSDSLPTLDVKEEKEIENYAAKYKELEAKYKQEKAAREAAEAANLRDAVLGKAAEEVKPRSIKEKVVAEANAALNRLKERGGLFGRKLFQGGKLYQESALDDLDPEVVKDLVTYAKGFDTLKAFTASLTKEFGEEAAPYAQALFDKATTSLKKAPRSPKEVRDSIDANEDISGTDVYNMVKGYLTIGVPEGEVLERVHQDLQQVWPDISIDDVIDAFTGYGKVKFPSQEEIETKIRHLRQVSLIERQIGELKRGRVPKKTGQQRDPKDEEIRALEKEAKNLYKLLNITRDNEGELKSPLESIKSRFKNEIADRKAAIAARKPLPDKTPPTPYDEETKKLQAQLEEVRKQYDAVFADPAATEAQQLNRAIAGLDRLIEKEEQMLADGILKNPPRADKTFTDPEYLARKQKLADMRKARADAYLILNPKKSRAEVLHDAALAAQKRGLARDRQIVATGKLVVRRVSPLAYTPSAELQAVLAERDALGDLIDEMKKNARAAATAARKPQRDAAKLTRDIANAAKSLAKLDQQILDLQATGTLPTRRTRTGTTNPVLKAIRDARKERVKTLAALERAAKQTKSPRELLEERRIAALAKREQELKDMMARGQYLKIKKTPEPLNAKEQAAKFALEQVERDFEKFRQEKMLENATAFEKAKRVVHGGYRFVRMWKLMGNFIGLLQGAQFTYRKLTSGQWISLARAVRRAARAGFNDQQADAEYKANVAELEALGFSEKEVRLLNPNETSTLRKEDLPDMDIFEKLSKADPSILNLGAPLVFKALRKMELINQSFLNQARVDTVKTMMGWANGRVPTEEERKNIGKIAEVVTGRGQVGKNLENAIPFLNDFLFNSLRWTVSQFQNALGYPVWKAPRGMRLKTLDQLYIRPKIGKVLLGTLTSMLMGAAGDDDDEEERKRRLKKWWDPREASFGKVPLPRGGSLDIGQGEGATLHFIMNNLLGWEFQRGGEKVKLRDSWVWGDGGELDNAKVPFQGDLKDKDIDYLLNRMNVVSAAILRNTVWREKFGGGSPEVLDTMKDFFVPLIAEDTFNMFKLYGMRGAIIWLETLQGASFNESRPKKPEKRASDDTILGSLFSTTPSKRKTDIFEPVSDKPKKRSAGDLFR